MEVRADLATDAGMHLLWGREHFPQVVDYDTWEPELLEDEDIERHIAAGHVVPINIHADGMYAFTLRLDGDARLTPDEQKHVRRTSHPNRFVSLGHVDLSGIEAVEASVATDGSVASAPLPPGEYSVPVFQMDYGKVRRRTDQHPDFIVLVEPAVPGTSYRLAVDTFDEVDEDEEEEGCGRARADHCGDGGGPAVGMGDGTAQRHPARQDRLSRAQFT
jgi:hypothetical protein